MKPGRSRQRGQNVIFNAGALDLWQRTRFTGLVFTGEWVYNLKRADPGKILLISGDQNAAMNYSSGCNNSIREFYPVHTTQINGAICNRIS